MKKVLIIHTVYSGGGAAKVAKHVFEFMSKDDNFDAYFAYGRGARNNNKKIFKFGFILENYIHMFLVRFLGIEGFGSYFSTRKLIRFIKKEKFDLIHIHNLHGYYLNFFDLVNFLGESGISVVWTLHDEWPITWMPAHSMGCSHCKTLLGECTNSYKYPKTYNKIFARSMLNKKRETFSKKWKPAIICPSDWLKKEIEDSYLKDNKIISIHNGVDTDVFKPLVNKEELKKKYNIPLDKQIVLFSISKINDINKGYIYITETIKKIKDNNIYFVGVGDINIKGNEKIGVIGYVSEEKSLAEVYNLADVLIYTSLVETMPLTVIESMSSGLPVVAFNIPGVQELTDKDCGFLVEAGDINGLVTDLESLAKKKEDRENMGIKAREKAVNYLSLNKTLSEYKNLYGSILGI